MELTMILSYEDVALIIATAIAVTKGITEFFKIEDTLQKRLTTILVCCYLILAFAFKDNAVLQSINTFLVVIFGASGIYNFIPNQQKKLEIQENANALKVVELQQTGNPALALQQKELDDYVGEDSDEVEIL